MFPRITFSAAVISGLLLGVPLTMSAPAHGQIRFDTATAVPKTDPIYPVLAAHASLLGRCEDCKSAQRVFSDWVWVDSPAAAQLFPQLQFASISWDASPARGLEETVAIDTAAQRIVKALPRGENFEAYGELLVDQRVTLRDAADAKLVWDAFCDIHHLHWKDSPLKQVSASEWHLGISQYDQSTSVVGGFKTVVTQTTYLKVLLDPRTGQITSWEIKGDSSDEWKILLGVPLTMSAPTAVSKADLIYPVLTAHASSPGRCEDGKSAQPAFSDWVWIHSPAAAQLFPQFQFASISWDTQTARGLEETVAIDTATQRIVEELHSWGGFEAYGELLVDRWVKLRDAADAKLVWDAFCDIHDRHWKNYPLKKVSASEWHLGISTQTYYKVLVDPFLGRITSWESKVDSSGEPKIPSISRAERSVASGSHQEIQEIIQGLSHTDVTVRNQTARKFLAALAHELERTGQSRLPSYIEQASEQSSEIQQRMMAAFFRAADRETLTLLRSIAGDSSKEMRTRLEAIRLIGMAGAIDSDVFKDLITHDQDPILQQTVSLAAEMTLSTLDRHAQNMIAAQQSLKAMGLEYDEGVFVGKCAEGDQVAVELFLEAGMRPDAKHDGRTSLMLASAGGHTEIVRTLLRAGANVNAANKGGITALFGAAENGHVEVVRALVGAKANLEARAEGGNTALLVTFGREHYEKIVTILVRAGANVNASNDKGYSPLMAASRFGNARLVKLLLDAGADVRATTIEGESALTFARGHADVSRLLRAAAGN